MWRVLLFFLFFFGFLCLFVSVLFVSLVIAVLFGNRVHNCIGLLHFDKLLVFVEEVCLQWQWKEDSRKKIRVQTRPLLQAINKRWG